MRCRPGIVRNAEPPKVPDLRRTATRCTASGTRHRKSASSILLATHPRARALPPPRFKKYRLQKGGEAPKGACQPWAALRAAARSFGARPPFGASTAALIRNCDVPTRLQAMLPGTQNQAGVTCPILSQSSDSTSRLGRNTEGNDARSRSGAVCETARKRRTRSTFQIASGMRPLMSEMSLCNRKNDKCQDPVAQKATGAPITSRRQSVFDETIGMERNPSRRLYTLGRCNVHQAQPLPAPMLLALTECPG
jgi:hypothetical protein